jgi:hypothetical protein
MATFINKTLGRVIPYFAEKKPPEDLSVSMEPRIIKAKLEKIAGEKPKLMDKKVKDFTGKELTMKEVYENVCKHPGDFGAFESLDVGLRNVAANQKVFSVQKELEKCKTPEEFFKFLTQNPDGTEKKDSYLHDPAMRLGISNASRQTMTVGGHKPEFFEQVDKMLSEKVLADTLSPMKKMNYPENIDQKDIKRNLETQKTMMKIMLMGQLGQSKIYDDKQPADWKNTMSDMFMSGQRVGIILPGVEGNSKDSKEKREGIVTSIYGDNRGKDSGNKWRWAATHNVNLKSIEGKGNDEYEEIKVKPKKLNFLIMLKAIGGPLGSQFGMDIAAGGLGKTGPGGNVIKNDGSCGHFYSHIKKGDSTHHGTLLVGFESEAPGSTNYLGHGHGASAKAEKASCFGTQKNNTVGDPYGGREMDLSGIKPDDFKKTMDAFNKYIEKNHKLLESNNADEQALGKKNLEEVNKKLMGPKMNEQEFNTFMKKTCGFEKDSVIKDMFPTRDKSVERQKTVQINNVKTQEKDDVKKDVVNQKVDVKTLSPPPKLPPPPPAKTTQNQPVTVKKLPDIPQKKN